MKRTADRLFGRDYIWSVLGAGRFQMPIAATAAAQVRRVRAILEGLSLSVATPDDAREILSLKGASNTHF